MIRFAQPMTQMPLRRRVATLALAAFAALAPAGAAQLAVIPESGLVDAPFHAVLRGVLPGSRVTLSASRPDVKGRTWTAVGEYLADADGTVDVDSAPSLAGSYEGLSPHGLWCSALPVPPDKLAAYIADLPRRPEMGTAPELDVAALYRIELTASIDGKSIARATATRAYAPDVRSEEVKAAGRVRGVLYLPPPSAPERVPVLVLAGSGGGLPRTQAALLAAHGHPALAQGLFAYQDLPPTLRAIPLETVRSGARWLEQRTGARRVAVMGTSRGSEAAGLAASYFPDDFSAAVVLVPSHLSNGAFAPGLKELEAAWTLNGKPLPADRGETDSNNAADDLNAQHPPGFVGTPYYLETWSEPKVADQFGIPFERMAGPVLAIGAGADAMWPSFIGAEQIRRRLSAHGRSDGVEVHIYPGAGHLISRVGSGGPLSGFVFHPVARDFEATGGLPNANCEASYDAWDKVLGFLSKVAAR
ncbi:MAG: acyl-CoA thioesterase/BAAT N-terminal domain-containing protein [Gammaproteobacteria bacterium]|nr:acyl-CoA thioesterase/BAAT N-terminal domain-containing protein [Gammaproteobacteria bacterium]